MIKKFIHKWAWILLIIFCIVGIFNTAIGVMALICMLAPVLTATFKGRFWCGNFCPRGSFNDNILSKISRKNPIPKLLKNKWFKITFMVILMSAFAVQIFFAWGDLPKVGGVFVRMVLITTLLSIILGTYYNQRTWCTICPMGTLALYVSKIKFTNKKLQQNAVFNKGKCTKCNICTKGCS